MEVDGGWAGGERERGIDPCGLVVGNTLCGERWQGRRLEGGDRKAKVPLKCVTFLSILNFPYL